MNIKIDRKTNKDGTTRDYLYIVQAYRKKGSKYPSQRIIASLGRVDQLKHDEFDALIKGLGKYSAYLHVLDLKQDMFMEDAYLLGPRLIAEHLWKKLRIPQLLRQAEVPQSTIESLFLMVLSRLHRPASKRSINKHQHWYLKPDEHAWSLNTYYRSLDRVLPYIKTIEDSLYHCHYKDESDQLDLFNLKDLEIIFFDTTSVSVYHESDNFFRRGHSKDHRSDLCQFIVSLVLSSRGDPLCHYLHPGNTSDADSFFSAVEDVIHRFPVRRVIFVADRGCVSQDILDILRKADIDYVVGARLRNNALVRDEVLSRGGRYVKYDEELSYKMIQVGLERYGVVLNKKQAVRDRAVREKILKNLKHQEGKSLKGLTRNRGYRRYLKSSGRIELDMEKAKSDSRYDGKWVLQTNTSDLKGSDLIEIYKGLSVVENWFGMLKSELDVAPVYHHLEDRVRGHVFTCFLGMKLWYMFKQGLQDVAPEKSAYDVWQDLEKLKGAELIIQEERWLIRSEFAELTDLAFRAVGCRRPERMKKM